MNKINKIFLAPVIAFLIIGCAPSSGQKGFSSSPIKATSARDFNPLTLNEIVVVPFEEGEHAKISQELLKHFNQKLEHAFEVGTSLQVANMRLSKKLSEALNANTANGKVRALQVGRQLGVQGVLHGVVTSYSDPQGNGHDAQVGFILWMVDVSTGRTVWEASFDHRNQPLTDNLFRLSDRLKEGIAYQRADAIFEFGIKESAKTYEILRNKNVTTNK